MERMERLEDDLHYGIKGIKGIIIFGELGIFIKRDKKD